MHYATVKWDRASTHLKKKQSPNKKPYLDSLPVLGIYFVLFNSCASFTHFQPLGVSL